jgi:hypothetical protein
MRQQKERKALLGIGLDNQDGHTRLTKGDNFLLAGGSKETHSLMQEKAVKINEHLKKSGKTLDTVSSPEFLDIAHKVGLKPLLNPVNQISDASFPKGHTSSL